MKVNRDHRQDASQCNRFVKKRFDLKLQWKLWELHILFCLQQTFAWKTCINFLMENSMFLFAKASFFSTTSFQFCNFSEQANNVKITTWEVYLLWTLGKFWNIVSGNPQKSFKDERKEKKKIIITKKSMRPNRYNLTLCRFQASSCRVRMMQVSFTF